MMLYARVYGTNRAPYKLAAGVFLPRSLTQQNDWLTKITWDIASWRKPLRKFEGFFEFCWKIHLRKGLKMVCLPGLFTSKLQQGLFCREKVFCWSCCKLKLRASCVNVKPWRLVVRGILRRLLQANLDGTMCMYAEQFYQTPKPGLRMKIKIFNGSHSHRGEVVLVTAYSRRRLLDLNFDSTKLEIVQLWDKIGRFLIKASNLAGLLTSIRQIFPDMEPCQIFFQNHGMRMSKIWDALTWKRGWCKIPIFFAFWDYYA